MATFEERIVEAFGGTPLPQIAEKLDINYHTLRNWAKEKRDIPPSALRQIAKTTNVSLNWLLLGEGEKSPDEKDSKRGIIDEAQLSDFIRRIVRDEFASLSSTSVQDLGSIDEPFDLRAAVERYDDPTLVMRDWYAYEKLPFMPGIVRPSGWSKMSIDQKVDQLKVLRNVQEQQRSIDEILAPK